MSKPRTLRYPQDLIKQGMVLLGKKLHKIRRQVMSGTLSKAEGREQGYRLLEEHYQKQVETINVFVKKKGLIGITGMEKDPREALEEAKEGWNGIINDMP